MNYPPIGVSHTEDCDDALEAGELELLCDECREAHEYDWD